MALTQQEIDAFNQVKNTVATLQTEYETVCASIAATKKQLAELPLLPVPVEDLKAAILAFVDARGKAYLENEIKKSITDFATHCMCGTGFNVATIGKPLGFDELESAISGHGGALSVAQLLTQFGKASFNDLVLYGLFGDLVKAGLSKVMDTMDDSEFGYSSLRAEDIGTDRATRHQAIQSAQKTLDALCARKIELSNSLSQLGVNVKAYS